MDNQSETRDFLATRRAKITPEQAGLPVYGGNRRVPGLRRGEVAGMRWDQLDFSAGWWTATPISPPEQRHAWPS